MNKDKLITYAKRTLIGLAIAGGVASCGYILKAGLSSDNDIDWDSLYAKSDSVATNLVPKSISVSTEGLNEIGWNNTIPIEKRFYDLDGNGTVEEVVTEYKYGNISHFYDYKDHMIKEGHEQIFKPRSGIPAKVMTPEDEAKTDSLYQILTQLELF